MALPHANFTQFGQVTIPANSTVTAEFDLYGFSEVQLFPAVTYQATSSVTGLSASATDGCGPASVAFATAYVNGTGLPGTIYYDSIGSILTLNPVLTNQVGPITVITKLNINIAQTGGWYKLTLKNNDSANAATVKFWADAS